MDKKAIYEFLNFLGASRPPRLPVEWNIAQLQYADIHFGMDADDAVLRRYFKSRLERQQPGTYVEIGAMSPALISNTYLFYLMGWRGLAIDANPAVGERWNSVRPRDAFESVAVGQTAGEAYWFEHASNVGMAKMAPENISPGADYPGAGVLVPVQRLDTLFARHFPDNDIQLLSIDIEGGELDALRGNDWNRWRPEVIIMEAITFDIMQPRADAATAFLLDAGYKLDAKVGSNVILRDGRSQANADRA